MTLEIGNALAHLSLWQWMLIGMALYLGAYGTSFLISLVDRRPKPSEQVAAANTLRGEIRDAIHLAGTSLKETITASQEQLRAELEAAHRGWDLDKKKLQECTQNLSIHAENNRRILNELDEIRRAMTDAKIPSTDGEGTFVMCLSDRITLWAKHIEEERKGWGRTMACASQLPRLGTNREGAAIDNVPALAPQGGIKA